MPNWRFAQIWRWLSVLTWAFGWLGQAGIPEAEFELQGARRAFVNLDQNAGSAIVEQSSSKL